jgi:hypothetical protein
MLTPSAVVLTPSAIAWAPSATAWDRAARTTAFHSAVAHSAEIVSLLEGASDPRVAPLLELNGLEPFGSQGEIPVANELAVAGSDRAGAAVLAQRVPHRLRLASCVK